MLEKGKIIEDTLIALGNITSYNDNLADEYIVASKLFDNIVKEVNDNTKLLFNAQTTKLNYATSGTNDFDEYVYFAPNNMLNLIGGDDVRLEGGYIYSKYKDATIKWSRELPLNDFPSYMEKLLKGMLGSAMSLAFSQYNERMGTFDNMTNEVLNRIQANEKDSNYSWWDKAHRMVL